jgi:hypothetical protein
MSLHDFIGTSKDYQTIWELIWWTIRLLMKIVDYPHQSGMIYVRGSLTISDALGTSQATAIWLILLVNDLEHLIWQFIEKKLNFWSRPISSLIDPPPLEMPPLLPLEMPHIPQEMRYLQREKWSYTTGEISSPLEMHISRTHTHISRSRYSFFRETSWCIFNFWYMWHCCKIYKLICFTIDLF